MDKLIADYNREVHNNTLTRREIEVLKTKGNGRRSREEKRREEQREKENQKRTDEFENQLWQEAETALRAIELSENYNADEFYYVRVNMDSAKVVRDNEEKAHELLSSVYEIVTNIKEKSYGPKETLFGDLAEVLEHMLIFYNVFGR